MEEIEIALLAEMIRAGADDVCVPHPGGAGVTAVYSMLLLQKFPLCRNKRWSNSWLPRRRLFRQPATCLPTTDELSWSGEVRELDW